LFALQEQFDKDMADIVDISNLSSDDTDRMSSVLFQMKQALGMMGLGNIFDHVREAQYLLSRKVLKMIQNYTPSKVQRIIKQDPTPEFINKTFLDYDVDIVESVMTDTQKQMAFLQWFTMKQAGVAVPDEMGMELAPMPVAKKYREQMQAQAEAQQQQAQQDAEDKQMVNKLLEAKAFTDVALGEERLSRIKYDAALSEERLAAAQEERARSVLDIVRAGKEFQDMDSKRAMQAVEMAKTLQEIQKLDAEDTIVPQPAVTE
jgi:hypothetical protein